MKSWFGPAIVTVMVSLAGCGESPQPAPAGGTRIATSSTPTLQYYLLSSSAMPNGHREAMIQENGRNGLSQQPPSSVTALLSAVASGDVEAARRALTDDALIRVRVSGDERGAESSLEAFMANVRGCTQVNVSWENDDEGRGAGTVSWRCPSRQGTQAMIWTDRRGVVYIWFGYPAQQ